ncbi:MAG: TIGR00725 family protein, partial [Anaerolineae bacterium]
MIIAVIGAGECKPEVARLAQEVGRRLAEKGAILICGG